MGRETARSICLLRTTWPRTCLSSSLSHSLLSEKWIMMVTTSGAITKTNGGETEGAQHRTWTQKC